LSPRCRRGLIDDHGGLAGVSRSDEDLKTDIADGDQYGYTMHLWLVVL
jgi:hypothetical protein